MKTEELRGRVERFGQSVASGILEPEPKAMLCLMHQAAMVGEIALQLSELNDKLGQLVDILDARIPEAGR